VGLGRLGLVWNSWVENMHFLFLGDDSQSGTIMVPLHAERVLVEMVIAQLWLFVLNVPDLYRAV